MHLAFWKTGVWIRRHSYIFFSLCALPMSFCSPYRPEDNFHNWQLCPFTVRLENLSAISLLLGASAAVWVQLLRPSWDLHWLGEPGGSYLLLHSYAGYWNTNRDSATQDLRSPSTVWHVVWCDPRCVKGTCVMGTRAFLLQLFGCHKGT